MNHHQLDWLVSTPAVLATVLLSMTMQWVVPAIEALAWGSGEFFKIGSAVVVVLQLWLLIRKLRK